MASENIAFALEEINERIKEKFGDDGGPREKIETLIADIEDRIVKELLLIAQSIEHSSGSGGGGTANAPSYNTTTVWEMGDLCWYSMALWRCKSPTNGAWNPAMWDSAGGGSSAHQIPAPTFDTAISFVEGDLTWHNSSLYRCKSPTTGAWDGSKWDGVMGIQGSVVSYAVGTSGTVAPTTGWQATVPTVDQGKYLWSQMVVTFMDSTTQTVYSASYQGVDGGSGGGGADTDLSNLTAAGEAKLGAKIDDASVASDKTYSSSKIAQLTGTTDTLTYEIKRPAGMYELTTVAVNDGGSGYALGDFVSINTAAPAMVILQVATVGTGGAVTGLTVISQGADTTNFAGTRVYTQGLGAAGTDLKVDITTSLIATDVVEPIPLKLSAYSIQKPSSKECAGGGGADVDLSNLSATGNAKFAAPITEQKRQQVLAMLNSNFQKTGAVQPKQPWSLAVGMCIKSASISYISGGGATIPAPGFVAWSMVEGYDFIFALGNMVPDFSGTAWDGIITPRAGTFFVYNRFTGVVFQIYSSSGTTPMEDENLTLSQVIGGSVTLTLKVPMQIASITGYQTAISNFQYSIFQAFSPIDLSELTMLGNMMEGKMNKIDAGMQKRLTNGAVGDTIAKIDISRLVSAGATPWPLCPTADGAYVTAAGTFRVTTKGNAGGGIEISWQSTGVTFQNRKTFMSSGVYWSIADYDDAYVHFDALTRTFTFKAANSITTMPSDTIRGLQTAITDLVDLADPQVLDGQDLLDMIEAVESMLPDYVKSQQGTAPHSSVYNDPSGSVGFGWTDDVNTPTKSIDVYLDGEGVHVSAISGLDSTPVSTELKVTPSGLKVNDVPLNPSSPGYAKTSTLGSSTEIVDKGTVDTANPVTGMRFSLFYDNSSDASSEYSTVYFGDQYIYLPSGEVYKPKAYSTTTFIYYNSDWHIMSSGASGGSHKGFAISTYSSSSSTIIDPGNVNLQTPTNGMEFDVFYDNGYDDTSGSSSVYFGSSSVYLAGSVYWKPKAYSVTTFRYYNSSWNMITEGGGGSSVYSCSDSVSDSIGSSVSVPYSLYKMNSDSASQSDVKANDTIYFANAIGIVYDNYGSLYARVVLKTS